MIRVLFDETNGLSAEINPDAILPLACLARWQDGFALIALGTWDVVSGDEPPIGLIEWLIANEGYLWDVFGFYLF